MTNNIYVVPKYKVFHTIPWNSDKLIGVSYNETMSLIDNDDWICFLDGDAVHTSSFFGKRIEDIINNNPDYSLLTCYTNRIGCDYQIAPNVNRDSNDQSYHRKFGENLWNTFGTKVVDITNKSPLSGVLILIKKSSWSQVGGFKEIGMLGVDNDIHFKFKNNGLKVGLMKGMYVQHWYRGGNQQNITHLK
jgi:GT2 family glycosyltransferase